MGREKGFAGVGAMRPYRQEKARERADRMRSSRRASGYAPVSLVVAANRLDVPLPVLLRALEMEGLGDVRQLRGAVVEALGARLQPPTRPGQKWALRPSTVRLVDIQNDTPPAFAPTQPTLGADRESAASKTRMDAPAAGAPHPAPVARKQPATEAVSSAFDHRRALQQIPTAHLEGWGLTPLLKQLSHGDVWTIPASDLNGPGAHARFQTPHRAGNSPRGGLIVLDRPATISTGSSTIELHSILWAQFRDQVMAVGWRRVNPTDPTNPPAADLLATHTSPPATNAADAWVPCGYVVVRSPEPVAMATLTPEARACLTGVQATESWAAVACQPSVESGEQPEPSVESREHPEPRPHPTGAPTVTPSVIARRVGKELNRPTPAPVALPSSGAVDRQSRRTTSYRTYLEASAGTALASEVMDVLRKWLRNKYPNRVGDDETVTDGQFVWPGTDRQAPRTVDLQTWCGEIDGRQVTRYLLVEQDQRPGAETWTTLVIAADGVQDEAAWVAVDVSNDGSKLCATPGFIAPLLDRIDLRDGLGSLRPKPDWVDDEDALLAVVESLYDPDRRYPVFLATSEASAPERVKALKNDVRTWTKKIVGQGHVAVLSPEMSAALTDFLPASLIPSLWSLRTFHPGLDENDPNTWHGHRAFRSDTLANRDANQIAGILAAAARSVAQAKSFPTTVGRVRRQVDKALREAARPTPAALAADTPILAGQPTAHSERTATPTTATPAPVAEPPSTPDTAAPAPGAASWWARLEAQVKQVMGVETIDESAAAMVLQALSRHSEADDVWDELDRELAEKEELQAEVELLTEELGTLETTLATKEAEILESERRRRYYQAELARLDEAAAYLEPGSDFTEAETFLDIEQRLDTLDFVVFTGDKSDMLALVASDPGHEARNAWRALYTLDRYAHHYKDRDVTQLRDFLEANEWGDAKITLSKWAPTESDSSRAGDLGKQRTFPVPTTCDPNGKKPMFSHFKLGQTDTRAPRMHYHDDLHSTGKIYVGYIGKHLKNTKSSRS